MGISIHAPLAGSDWIFMTYTSESWLFQSTLPLRGATTWPARPGACALFQSTLPLRGATRFKKQRCIIFFNFNPRSPCGERLNQLKKNDYTYKFQSTLPLRGATNPLFG